MHEQRGASEQQQKKLCAYVRKNEREPPSSTLQIATADVLYGKGWRTIKVNSFF